MSYIVEYFNQRVMDEIESWLVGILTQDLRRPASWDTARRRMKLVRDD
jgi:hypothetical protein